MKPKINCNMKKYFSLFKIRSIYLFFTNTAPKLKTIWIFSDLKIQLRHNIGCSEQLELNLKVAKLLINILL